METCDYQNCGDPAPHSVNALTDFGMDYMVETKVRLCDGHLVKVRDSTRYNDILLSLVAQGLSIEVKQ